MKKIWVLIGIGVILKLFISFFSFHPDIEALIFGGSLVSSGYIFTFYDYLFKLPSTDPLIKNFGTTVFTYPPLIYLFHGFFNFLYTKVLGLNFINQFFIINPSDLTNPLLHWTMLLIKLPYLIFDILTTLVLVKLFDNKKDKLWIAVLWIFNPVNLFSTYMIGDHDLIATFFIILSLFFVKSKKFNLSAISLGFGIAFKLFPLFLVVPLCLVEKNNWKKVKLIFLSFLPYLISILPYLSSHGYRATALLANQSLKSLYAAIPVSGGESILLFPLFLLLAYIFFYYQKSSQDWLTVFRNFLIIMFLFFIFTHTHPQWFLWITPLILIDLVVNKFRFLLVDLILLFSFIGLVLFFDPSLSVGLFSPLFPTLASDGSLWQILHLNLDYNFYRSILQTIFVSGALFLIYIQIKPQSDLT